MLVARPSVSQLGKPVPAANEQARLRTEQREMILEQASTYNPDAVMCVGVPFGHTRPQWILPHGGQIRLDGITKTVTADYS